ncbi:MAG: DUF6580 family putative transport protein [Bacteroidota bacterium]
MDTKITNNLALPIVLLAFAVLSRILPHPPNFTAIGAIALFGAAHLKSNWQAIAIPFAALFLSDLFINNVVYANYYDHFTWQISPFIYLAFALILALGYFGLRGKVKTATVVGRSLAASVIFYLFTNAMSWQIDPMYTKDFSGLMASYTAGIPFFFNTLAGDLFYCGVLFGSYSWVKANYLQQVVVSSDESNN